MGTGGRRRPLVYRRRRRRRAGASTRWVRGFGGAVVLCLALTGSTADARPGTTLARGLAFYRGKTITYIAPTSVGSPNDVIARALANEMGAYLHATINVEDIPAGQFIPGQNELAAAKPDGLTFGALNLPADYYNILTDVPGLDFNPERLAFLGGLPNVPTGTLISTQASSPYSSFNQVIEAARQGPVKMLTTAGAAASSVLLLMKSFGAPVQLVFYSNTGTLLQGFLRGDGPLLSTGESNLQSEIDAGQARVLLVGAEGAQSPAEGDYNLLRRVPTFGQYLKKFPPRTTVERRSALYFTTISNVPSVVIAAPGATPPDRVAALDAAARAAFLSPTLKSTAVQLGKVPGYVAPQALKLAYIEALKLAGPISAVIRA